MDSEARSMARYAHIPSFTLSIMLRCVLGMCGVKLLRVIVVAAVFVAARACLGGFMAVV